MQPLYLVGFTSDLSGLIFRSRHSDRADGFVVDIDDRLLGQIEELLKLRHEALPPGLQSGPGHLSPSDQAHHATAAGRTRRQSRLTPREIQARLRSGHSIAEVAAEAGVDDEWVSRFAAPVLAELAQVIDKALELTYNKPGIGPSAQPLAKSVAHNLAERKGASLAGAAFADAWSAYQRVDDLWVVCFSFVARRRVQRAEWIVDLAAGSLRAFNRLADDLGHVEPERPPGWTGRPGSQAGAEPGPLPTPSLFNRREESDTAGEQPPVHGNGGPTEPRDRFLRRRPAG
jgi:hypothetical protein